MTFDGMHRRTRYARLTAWLGLCAVVCLQIQVAGHAELEHSSPGGHEETCTVCLEPDKSGSVPLAVAAATVTGYHAGAPGGRASHPFAALTKSPRSARGPPTA